jgi:hypothetical protein
MEQAADNNSKIRRNGVSKKITSTFTGSMIGFLAAAVLYSKHLPVWVPHLLVVSPLLFFGVFIVICGGVGYIWSVTEVETAEKPKKAPLINTLLSGAFAGFLVAAVMYSKFLPSWIPIGFSIFPGLFFALFAVIGALISYLWSKEFS